MPPRLLPDCSKLPNNGAGAECAMVLPGGINNALMHLSQWISDSCWPDLDRVQINSGLGFGRAASLGSRPPSHPLSAIFRVDKLKEVTAWRRKEVADGRGGAKCGVHNASWVENPRLVGINERWYLERRYAEVLSRVYAALAPSPPIAKRVRDFRKAAGLRPFDQDHPWACVHLRLERDWTQIANMCARKRGRYCWYPADVKPQLERSGDAGRPLVIALSRANTDAKTLQLVDAAFPKASFIPEPPALSYTERAAVHMFVAAEAPVFWGNSFSTFSRGIAMVRAAHGQRSSAYDCADSELQPRSPHRQSEGFRLLKNACRAGAGRGGGGGRGGSNPNKAKGVLRNGMRYY